MEGQSLHHRIKAVVGQRSFREVAELTQTHPETVRRYVQGQSPSVEFLTALCQKMKINSTWLLTGQGPMHEVDVRNFALREANPSELLAAVAHSLELLTDRVIRLEVFVQTLEARLRAQSGVSNVTIESRPSTHGNATALPTPLSVAWPAAIAEVVTKRPGPDAGGTAAAPRT
jgi:transcriptional regulator with XRE-family HTH domain